MSTREGAATGFDTAGDATATVDPDDGGSGHEQAVPFVVVADEVTGAPVDVPLVTGPDHFATAGDTRTVTAAAGAVLAATAPAPARAWTVADATEPPALPDLAADPARGSRLAVVAVTIVTLGVLGGLGWLVWSAWQFVTTASDAAQAAHWEQLRGLIDVVVAVVLLIVGTVLGASLQSRWTTSARVTARAAVRAATAQNAAANANAEAARHNAAAAVTAGSDLARALDLLDRTRPLLADLAEMMAGRDRAATQLVTVHSIASATREPHIAGYRLDRSGDVRIAETADETVDRHLTTLGVRAGVLAEQIGDWVLRRR